MEIKFAFAKTIIYEAAAYIRERLDEPIVIATKSGPTDLVTQLDEEVQDQLVQKILASYPEDKIFAEEKGLRHPIFDGQVWVIDPIDGTNNFIAQQTDFAIMLAYFENGVGQFGFIYDVMRDELYHGGGQFDVYCNEQKLAGYRDRSLQQSLISISAGFFQSESIDILPLVHQSLGTRLYGSAGISFAKVLSGRLLLYVSSIFPWDYAAASILAEKLGYQVLTIDGQIPDFQTRQDVMIAPIEKMGEITSYIVKKEGVR
ncbi:inositol monophosphatase family protein [Streptococcus himalayensis]|uniref:Inositol monophosphatase n=1 Tax=Streptococcus himalayensis TaxID=1888195 RepID=A0A917EE09_9STRE|nr:inositol monophosphatase family protein [Streptococcus himalayensis]GGE28119.1 inositol monophosphatase [Streptococcus himalayensis]